MKQASLTECQRQSKTISSAIEFWSMIISILSFFVEKSGLGKDSGLYTPEFKLVYAAFLWYGVWPPIHMKRKICMTGI
jgi:hypothetical protein